MENFFESDYKSFRAKRSTIQKDTLVVYCMATNLRVGNYDINDRTFTACNWDTSMNAADLRELARFISVLSGGMIIE